MQDELYADGIGEITITGTVVRIDLVSLSPTERDANGSPKAAFRQRVIMPADAFANAVDLMQRALAGLVEAGTVKKQAAGGAVEPRTISTQPGPTRPSGQGADAPVIRNTSPNFN